MQRVVLIGLADARIKDEIKVGHLFVTAAGLRVMPCVLGRIISGGI